MARKPALTKAEREAITLRRALGWPDEPEPTPIEPPDELQYDRAWRAWWMNPHSHNVGRGTVVGGGSTRRDITDAEVANRHKPGGYLGLSQGRGGPWYATEADALLALRWAVTRKAAEALVAVDSYIATRKADR